MVARKWYFREANGSEYGPLSSAEIRNMARLGRIVAETPVRTDTSRGWTVAWKVKGLLDDPGAGPTGRAGGAPEDHVSEFLADLATPPRVAGPEGPRIGQPPVPDAPPIATFIVDDEDTSLTRAADHLRRYRAGMARFLIDPRGTFEQALEPGMQALALAMIAATAVLYVLMWLPPLYAAESLQENMRMGFQFPRGMIAIQHDDRTVPISPPSEVMNRIIIKMWKITPGLLLAVGLALGAVGATGTFAMSVLAADPRPEPLRRGIAALGLSLTPLVCILPLALLTSFVALEVALPCAYFGVFVSVLFYHEALQAIGGIPSNRAPWCTPVIVAIGTYLLARCSAGAGISMVMGGLPF